MKVSPPEGTCFSLAKRPFPLPSLHRYTHSYFTILLVSLLACLLRNRRRRFSLLLLSCRSLNSCSGSLNIRSRGLDSCSRSNSLCTLNLHAPVQSAGTVHTPSPHAPARRAILHTQNFPPSIISSTAPATATSALALLSRQFFTNASSAAAFVALSWQMKSCLSF